MSLRTKNLLVFVLFASRPVGASSAQASIVSVAILPTCTVTPRDRVVMEVLVLDTSPFAYKPPLAIRNANQIYVDVFIDSGSLDMLDTHLSTVEIGFLESGTYEYTIQVHSPDQSVAGPIQVSGSFFVGREPCRYVRESSCWMYWADQWAQTIKRATSDGLRVENLRIPGVFYPSGFAIDPIQEKFYWAESFTGRIRRANLDGQIVEEILSGLLREESIPQYLTFSQGYLFWSEFEAGSILRMNADGSGLIEIASRSSGEFAIDSKDGKIYWRWGKLLRANLDGSSREVVTSEAWSPIVGPLTRKLYWIVRRPENGCLVIQRANLDGSEAEDLVLIGGLSTPWALALDERGGRLYWALNEDIRKSIWRVTTDGTGLEEIVVDRNHIVDIIVGPDDGKIYWTTASPSTLPRQRIMRANSDGSDIETVLDWHLDSPFGLTFVCPMSNPPEREQPKEEKHCRSPSR